MKSEERYSRQKLFAGVGAKGQKKLAKARVAIVGLGALGSVVSELLVRAGVGQVILVDRDCVELTNLQRQALYDESDVGKTKVAAAKEKLVKINSQVEIIDECVDVNYKTIAKLLGDAHVIVDCCDNLSTRYLVNEFCKKFKKPWIYGGAISSIGSVLVFGNDSNNQKSDACFSCVFSKMQAEGTCDTIGVLNGITHLVGSLQANECIKLLVGAVYEKRMMRINIWDTSFDFLKIKKDTQCGVCRGNYEYLEGKREERIIKYCSSGMYQIYGKKKSLRTLKARLSKIGSVVSFKGVLHFKELTIFADGRVTVKAKSEAHAKSLYAKYIGN